jgi:hypothetical protein
MIDRRLPAGNAAGKNKKSNAMKKIILLLIALFFCFDGLFAAEACSSSSMPDLIITITIDLHSRKSGCQSGFGFCKVSIGFSWQMKATTGGIPGIKSQAYLSSSKQLTIKIAEADLQNYENGVSLKYFKGRQTIVVDDTYELSKEVSSALGSESILVIKQGEYPVRFDGTYYEIMIPQ